MGIGPLLLRVIWSFRYLQGGPFKRSSGTCKGSIEVWCLRLLEWASGLGILGRFVRLEMFTIGT